VRAIETADIYIWPPELIRAVGHHEASAFHLYNYLLFLWHAQFLIIGIDSATKSFDRTTSLDDAL